MPVPYDGGLAEQLNTAGTVIGKEAAKNALFYGMIGSAIGTVAGAIPGLSIIRGYFP